jgi:hypothetical protein
MTHHFGKIHLVDKRSLDRVNSAILLSLVVSGLAVCGIGATVFDVGRWVSAW